MTGVSNTQYKLFKSVSNIFVTKRGNFLALRARLYMEAEALQRKDQKNLEGFLQVLFLIVWQG